MQSPISGGQPDRTHHKLRNPDKSRASHTNNTGSCSGTAPGLESADGCELPARLSQLDPISEILLPRDAEKALSAAVSAKANRLKTAAVLGANDGLLSTSSLVLGVAAAHVNRKRRRDRRNRWPCGRIDVHGRRRVCVGMHSQADTEAANLDLERTELWIDNNGEHRELAAIYVGRGLDPQLAKQVADQLMAHHALGSHARDKLGISETLKARPIQADLFPRPALRLARRCRCSSPRLFRIRRC
jgi:VIT family